MRRFIPVSVLAVGAVMAACSTPETTIATTAIPTAGVRFINAVPDTGAAYGLDMRFVDIVESNSHFRIPFRNAISSSAPFVATLTEYKPAREGSRHFVVFLDDTIQAIAQIKLKDTTFSFTASHNYTALMQGNARSSGADKMRLTIMDETVPDPGTQIALRAVNTTSSPVDVRVYLQGGTVPAAADWTIPAYSASPYITKAPGIYLFNVRAAGATTNLVATDAATMPGTAATVDVEAIPGSNVAGSALSAFIYPPSVTGSKAPQGGAFAAPAIGFNWDRRPPRTCSPLC